MKTKAGDKANGTIKVESGIPIPPPRAIEGIGAALDSMKVGDSFRIARSKYGSVRTMASARGYALTTRKDGDSFIRVWRVR